VRNKFFITKLLRNAMSSVSEKVAGNRDVKMTRGVVEIVVVVVEGVVDVVVVVVDFGIIGVVEGTRFM
jgi:hypothetical protein